MSNSLATESFAIGHIDYAKSGYAYGWAFNQTQPASKISVEILAEDIVVAYGIADQYRSDLDELNFGDGCHGFRLKISEELLDGRSYQLNAREARTGAAFLGGPVEFGPELQAKNFSTISRKAGNEALSQILKKHPALNIDQKNAFAKVYEIGALAQETGRFEDAEYAWSSLNHTLGVNALCLSKMAEIKLIRKDNQQALLLYKKAAEINYAFHWAHLGIMTIQDRAGNYDEAIEALCVATALDKKCDQSGEVREGLEEKQLSHNVDSLITSQKNHEAVTLVLAALKTRPENLTAQKLLNALAPPQKPEPVYQYGQLQLDKFKDRLKLFENFLLELERTDQGV